MGMGMAMSLLRAGYPVQGYDVIPAAAKAFAQAPGQASIGSTIQETIAGASVVLLMVQNAAQAEDVLFGSGGIGAASLVDGAVVILSSTVAPAFTRELNAKLGALHRNIALVDAPVSGGIARAANGTLTIICSGDEPALNQVTPLLLAMSGTEENLFKIDGGIGSASSIKTVNQLLAGVHIAAAAEALSFAASLGLNTRRTFQDLLQGSAWSWMLENRGPQMLDADWTPHSALAIFVKDLGIVLDEARRLGYYAPIAATAHTLYLQGAAQGWEKEADSGVVRLWQFGAGTTITSSVTAMAANTASASPRDYEILSAATTLATLPAVHSENMLESIQDVVNSGSVPVLVVLDDDPTGTQTCHDIDVLTVWDIATLEDQFRRDSSGFFILTNSRALPSDKAKDLIITICNNLKAASQSTDTAFEIVLRGDSTLRGHLPEEPEAAEAALGKFDGWVLAPFFAQGGRLTIDDVHYVKEGDDLVPVSQTPFAQDATFGYKSSNLRDYITEKCGNRFDASSFLSISIEDIRTGGAAAVTAKLLTLPAQANTVIIVNAVEESDMHVFVAGLLDAEKKGRRYLYRTGAAFVSSRLGISSIPPLTLQDLDKQGANLAPNHGGLIIAGSHVPKTTAQLEELRKSRGDELDVIELDVAELLESDEAVAGQMNAVAATVSAKLEAGTDVLVMTSRELVKGECAVSSLEIGSRVASALVQLLESVEVRPRYLIAKGGITSSDAASKALRMRRARVIGQAAPGVPLWRCDEITSRHCGVAYVVFPGNVGSNTTLAEVVTSWARS
ncbi:hypothetical protein VHEMI07199 [[Torrubiella] hemipterigena]|nr:hypothetical protein VHEMI07199 [[Torrubiella] hemipterigena]